MGRIGQYKAVTSFMTYVSGSKQGLVAELIYTLMSVVNIKTCFMELLIY